MPEIVGRLLLANGIDGIAISPTDPANQTGMLNDAAASVPLVTQDSDAPDSNRICYIGTDNFQAGQAAGEHEPLERTIPATKKRAA